MVKKKKRRALTEKEIRIYSIIITASVVVSFFSHTLLNAMIKGLPEMKAGESNQVSFLMAAFSIIAIAILLMLMFSYYFLLILILNWIYKPGRKRKKKRR